MLHIAILEEIFLLGTMATVAIVQYTLVIHTRVFNEDLEPIYSVSLYA